MLQWSNSQTSCLQSKCSDGSDLSILSKLCDTVPGIQTFLTSFGAASIGEILLVHARKVDQQQVHLGKHWQSSGGEVKKKESAGTAILKFQFWWGRFQNPKSVSRSPMPSNSQQEVQPVVNTGSVLKRGPQTVLFTHFQTQMHAEHIIHSKLWKGFLKHHLLHCISTNWSRDLSCDEDLLTFYLMWWL